MLNKSNLFYKKLWVEPPIHAIPKLSDAILQLSGHYINNPQAPTPWTETYCQDAYRYYFLPLNYLRAHGVIQRGLQVNFFSDLDQYIDWGAGPGTASLALAANLKKNIKKQILIDHSSEVFKVFSDLHDYLIQPELMTVTELKPFLKQKSNSCLVFSYSITELNELPKDWNQFEALMILEPSTSEDGRKLLKLREELINQGYYIWAPCIHQNTCPLLSQSKYDWCHDRFHVQAPEWFQKLESHLPIKNKTVTTSYLFARKKAPPTKLNQLARLTGDSLEEKGKTRQLICRGPNREFLSWLHKNASVQVLPRGELVNLPNDLLLKSNELRVQSLPIETIPQKI